MCNSQRTWSTHFWTLAQGLGEPCLSKLSTSFHLLLSAHQRVTASGIFLSHTFPCLCPPLPLGIRATSSKKTAQLPVHHSQQPLFLLPSSHHTSWGRVINETLPSPRAEPVAVPPWDSTLNMQMLLNVHRMDWMNLSVIHNVRPTQH